MEVALARESRLSSLFQDALLKARLVPISSLVPRLYRAVRAIAIKYGKEFEFTVEGDDTEMDRSVYEDVAAPLLHLVRNAIYHGVETPRARQAVGKPPVGKITLSARYEGAQLVISVSDDGNGFSAEQIRATAIARGLIDSYTQLDDHALINLIFQPGFSTSKEVTEEAGRGIGLDVVRDTVTRLRGTVEVDSVAGTGTTFIMKIPISLQIQRVVLARAGDQTYAIPMTVVEQLVQLDFYPRSLKANTPALEVRGETYPLVHLSTFLNFQPGPASDKSPVLLLHSGQRRWAMLVDSIAGRQEIVAKNLGPHLRSVPTVSGATVLGNGQVVLILDPVELLQRPLKSGAPQPYIPPPGTAPSSASSTNLLGDMPAGRISQPGVSRNVLAGGSPNPHAVPYILVVDDSPSVRRVVSATLKNAGWDVLTARDGQEALEIVAQRMPAGILLDIEMPRMDGYELMAALRGQPLYQHIPLIVLTSRAATKHQQRALQLGADAYVVKPYQDDQLLGTINGLVRVKPNGDPR
jgi:CheY-like chemotaxis protein/chemotaxis signal transduction protein